MLVKKNKDKENTFSYRKSPCPSPDPDRMSWVPVNTAECKNRHYGNSVMLNLTLHTNKKLLKMRRSSNFNTKTVDAWQIGQRNAMQTVQAKRMPLCENREKSKKSCRSVGANHEQLVFKQSNFNLLKEQAKRLDEDFSLSVLKKWKPVSKQDKDTDCTSVNNQKVYESTGLIDSIKRSRRANMRKIVKGRPQIKKLVEQSREKDLKQKALEYVDVLMTEEVGTRSKGIKIRRVGNSCGGFYQSIHTIS